MKKHIEQECPKHGMTTFVLRSNKGGSPRYRCKKCAVEAVQRRREKIKQQAVEYMGGKCTDCGFETEHLGVYEFHHPDPNEKDFAISQNGATRSWEKTAAELDKCVMLCANCHRIRHSVENVNAR